MTIKRMDHVSIVVEDIQSAIDFFTTFGLTVEGQTLVKGEIVDRLCGLTNVQADIAMMRTPDGHGRIELTKYHSPDVVPVVPAIAPPNALGLRQIMFAVENIDDTVSRLSVHGSELIGEMVNYGTQYRLCYVRGPAGIIIALAQEL